MNKSGFLLAAAAVALTAAALAGCKVSTAPDNGQAAEAAGPASSEWKSFVNSYIDTTFKAAPQFGAVSGRHEFDGKLPDWSQAGIDVEKMRLRGAIDAAGKFTDDKLGKTERFERDYLIAQARGALFWMDTADQPHTNPAYYANSLDPSVYVVVPYAPPPVRMKAYTAYLKAIPGAAQAIRANIRSPMPLSFVNYAKSAFGGYAEYYPGDGLKAFAGVGSDVEQADLKSASTEAAAAMKGLADWAESQRAGAGTNFALGAAKFQQMLHDTELVDTPIAELQRIGQADLKSNQDLLRAACGRFAAGATIPACVDKMNINKPAGGAVAAARLQLAELKQFVADKDIVTIPGTEEAKVEEAPPYNRQNFAYINIPGPYEKNLPSVYYIAPPDPTWTKAVQDGFVPGKADLLFTSAHEVWPGHFLNFLHANRSPFLFGRVFVGYAFAEGWAHYTEEMMRVKGVGGGTDETMIGQLSNALLRDCRFLSAIGMHSGTMTQDQSYTMFRDQCFQDEGNAKQQAARGTYDPAYLNYTMGKLMIRKLRDDWVATRGGEKAWKGFHDQFLSYGGPPIPLVRQQMLGGEAKAVF
ncbi:MAG: DUF885 domain-containing protein [Sphingomonas sp.]|uniref:DUF885 domain-containing protein n=1 Tax=Sphingomonas sp. TaxID=28214 RepID=UPI0017B29201|nr:DUF885 domain-containing protein [Sphingomonas sp.]MBA3667252.1 DUF885 domain-containing protein [Sphingomonas sp.]